MPWGKALGARPSAALPVAVAVNGIPALPACAAGSIQLDANTTVTSSVEPRSITWGAKQCVYANSAWATPSITDASPLIVDAPGVLTLQGSGFPAGTSATDLSLTVGDEPCAGVSVTASAAAGELTVTCQLPLLPSGIWNVSLTHATAGAVSFGALGASPLTLRYNVVVTGCSPTAGSLRGGQELTLTGHGFAPLDPAAAKGCATRLQSASSTYTLEVLSISSTTTLVARVVESRNTASSSRNVSLTVFVGAEGSPMTSSANIMNATTWHQFATAATVSVGTLSPSTLPSSSSPSSLSVSWTIPQGTDAGNAATPVGEPSAATIRLRSGADWLPCASPTVTASAITATSYSETSGCTLPANVPASNYTVWVCYKNFGCGYPASALLHVPLAVSAMAPVEGGAGGGLVLTISGSGFNAANASEVAVRFGPVACSVLPTTSTATSLQCKLGALPPAVPVGSALPLSIVATDGASNVTFADQTFTFLATLTPEVSGISPTRGSTAGGTAVTITGSNFGATAADTTVTLAGVPCTNVVVVSSTTITCTSGDPSPNGDSDDVPIGEQPVVVTLAGSGDAVPAAGAPPATWRYVDLWSRATTWGGGPLPAEGDSV